MHELTAEWVEKAENDYRTAVVVLEEIAEPIVDTACFHCQQCAEKYLKAFLTEHQIEFPRQHPLIPLLELCIQQDASFRTLLSDLRTLEGYAVAVRYPGSSVTLEMAQNALAAATKVRTFIRQKLGFIET
jgi:HEPN domain-containing protein